MRKKSWIGREKCWIVKKKELDSDGKVLDNEKKSWKVREKCWIEEIAG